ncbi:MAG: tetratricopeptide repeat protein [Methanoregula sp.]|nr:tetratricopeptide repeat protein [Methanoregula sp.]
MRPNTLILLIFAILACTLAVLPVTGYSGDAVNWYTKGNTLTVSRNYTEAIAAFDQAISLEPEYVEALNGKADALNRAQRYSDALQVSDQVIALNPDYVRSGDRSQPGLCKRLDQPWLYPVQLGTV